ncbi:zinc-binding alcohol dehydrogenase family protein [uncultured Enterococcus sp.]|uniref:zinc-binding alcohol dehydrogenase family protein n=1 Tax=uncultured Enterococcus sp. TaxID=167972 RepID=UPI002AA6BB28|nr:zinc-binding alcohol dehydrogenase family protein [uncultured Enterococcus sp.]
MDTMKAVLLKRPEEPGGTNYFDDGEIDIPDLIEENDLLIEVKGISVNPVDIKTSKKSLDEQSYRVLGWDGSGVVKQIGSAVKTFSVGDEVFYAGDYTRSGSYSQYQLVDQRLAAKKPEQLSMAESAAVPLTTLTAWESLFDRLRITEKDRGKKILIINGAGGVGSAAIQLAKHAGLEVITTASRVETLEWVNKMGADRVINHRQSLSEELRKIGVKELPYILCLYNPNVYWEEMAKIIQPQGRICSIVDADRPVDLSLLKSKSVTFSWEFMFTRAMYRTEDMHCQGEILAEVAALYDQGVLSKTMTKHMHPINAENIEDAHKIVGSGKMIGKLVLTGW